MKYSYIGSFRLGEFPNNANINDIIQLISSKDQVYDDGHGHFAVDRDLLILNSEGYWIKFDPSAICNKYLVSVTIDHESHISNLIALTNNDLITVQKLADGFINKDVNITVFSMETGATVIDSKRITNKKI